MAMKPTITIGTGYEQAQRKAASRRKLAEAMLSQGLEDNPNMTSWAQVLGKAAQAWAGKSMQRQADTMEADVATKIREDYNTRRQGFLADAQALKPEEVVAKYGNDPLLADEVDPYRKALATALAQREQLTKFGGQMVRQGDVMGRYENDPNESVFVNPDGTMSINPVKIAASVASQGEPLVDENGNMLYQTTGRLPGTGPAAPAPMPAASASVPESSVVSSNEAIRALRSMPNPANFATWVQKNGFRIAVQSSQEAAAFPSGTPLLLPDGTEGVVP